MRTIDTRDLWDEHDEIEERLEAIADDGEGEPDQEDVDRLAELKSFLSDVDPGRYGVTLIDEADWEDYAKQYAYDSGVIEEGSVISLYVDWSTWADDLGSEYSVATLDGTDYYYKS